MDQKPPDTFDFDSSETQGSQPDGARTSSRGPCRCGWKHWCDGVEYDYVFAFEGRSLGFNEGDSADTVAEKFVCKYRLGGFNSRPVICEIANRIRQAIHEHHGGSSFNQTPKEEKSDFNPEQWSVHRPTLNTTAVDSQGKMKKTVYHDSAWGQTIKQKEEEQEKIEAKAFIEKAKMKQEKENLEREQLRKQIERNNEETKASKELERLRSAKKSSENLHPWVDENGVRYVTLAELAELKKKSGAPTISQQIVDASDDEMIGIPPIQYEYPGPNITLEQLTNSHVMAKLNRDGKSKTKDWLASLGIDEPTARHYIKVSKSLDLQMKQMYAMAALQQQTGMIGPGPMGPNMMGGPNIMGGMPSPGLERKEKPSGNPWGGHGVSLAHSLKEKEKKPEETAQISGPSIVEDFKIVVDQKVPVVKVRISLNNKVLCDVTANTTNTLQDLYNHIRSVASLNHQFNIYNPTASNKKLESWGSTLKELGIDRPTRLNIEKID